MSRRGGVLVGVSGPDGSGKTTLVRSLERTLRAEGFIVERVYAYGCVACRRFRAGGSGGLRDPAAPGREAAPRRGALRTTHAVVDALELLARVLVASARASLRASLDGSRRPFVVVSDRSPLDGLVKHRPGPRTLGRRIYLRAAWRFDAIVLLDAPPPLLARRDREHDVEQLAEWRRGFSAWAALLPRTTTVDTSGRSADTLATSLAVSLLPASAGTRTP